MTARRRPTATSCVALAALVVELATAWRCPEETLCPDLRRAFRMDTRAGRAVFVALWAGFSAWLFPHLFRPVKGGGAS